MRNFFLIGILYLITLFFTLWNKAGAQPLPLATPEIGLSGKPFTQASTTRGSQYHIDEWMVGNVYLKSGFVIKDKMLRYNGFLDDLLWLPSPVSQQVMLDKGLIDHIVLLLPGNRSIIYENITFKGMWHPGQINIIAQRLYRGEIALMVHRRVKQNGEFRQRTDRGTYIIPIMKPDPIYYLVFENSEAAIIRRFSRRALALAFKGKEKEIRKLLRENKIRIRDEKQLTDAVIFLDNSPVSAQTN